MKNNEKNGEYFATFVLCGPCILAQCVSHSNGELNFYLKNWFLFD